MTSTPSERCPERAKLSDGVAEATTETRKRQAAYEDVKAKKADAPQVLAELQFALNSELKAQHLLRKHIREHGCQS